MKASQVASVGSTIAGLRFWTGWLLASTFGALVALGIAAEIPFFVGLFSGRPTSGEGYSVAWVVILAGLLAGAVLGSTQWLLLRSWLPGGPDREQSPSGRLWTAASTLGFGLGFTIAWAPSGRVHAEAFAHHGLPHAIDNAGVWGGVLVGAALAGAQGLALLAWRSRDSRRLALRWLAIGTLSFGVSWSLAAIASAPVEAAFGPMNHLWGGAVFGLLFGAISGSGLVWLSRRGFWEGGA